MKLLSWRIEYRHKCGKATFYLPNEGDCCSECGDLAKRSDYEKIARQVDRGGWSMKYTGKEKNHGKLTSSR